MQCLKVLTMSGWNPPPGNRKMHGDLMYLYIVTVEERHVSVTASTRGFYLNQLVNDSILLLQSLVRTVNTSIKKKNMVAILLLNRNSCTTMSISVLGS